VKSTVTGADGKYSFTNLGPGTYFVQETVPAGYKQTGGNAGYTIKATSGINSGSNNFDNALLKPGIDIEKTTNGSTNSNPIAPDYDNEDAVNGPGVPVLTPGSTVTWTYKVTNTGEIPFTFNQVVVTDDNGTATTSDDMSTTNGKITFLSILTGNADNILDPGEVWLYTASGIVQALAGSSSGTPATFDFSGNSALDGTNGNIRSFSANGINVKASAFGRNSSGVWSSAWLGSYAGGLGVTDNNDGTGSGNEHTVDNSGSNNYVLFEFDQSVILDSAFLGYVVGDSDLTIWIGNVTNAFNNHQTLSDAFLSGLGFTEINNTSSSGTRTADVNAGGVAGNVIVIASKIGDTDDKFKIQNLTVYTPVQGYYENKATVTVPGGSDSDLSHYKNNKVTGTITGTKYLDTTGNGFSSDDTGLGGVTIKLFLDKNNNNVVDSSDGAPVATTVTASDGSYSFGGLGAGKYLVQEVVPSGYIRTGPADSDTYVVTLAAGQTVTGKDFDNFEMDCDLSDFCNVYYIVNGKKVYDLRGNTNEGDTVTAYFTYKGSHTDKVTLVSYYAPASSFDAKTAYLQQIYESKTIVVQPGKSYSITVHNPDCFYQVDFVCGEAIDRFGPANSNIFYTPQGRLISADNDGTHACFCGDSSISGFVFADCDNDGDMDPNENGIKGVLITLTGKNDLGQDVLATTYTDSDGYYEFDGLRDGTYKIVETQPSGYTDGKDSIGNFNGVDNGVAGNDVFSSIVITGGHQDGEDYNFGEVCKTTTTTTTLCSGMTATIGYWQNKNGQALIKAMNGGSSKTNLGNWLANNFPNLFGGLKNKSNTDVAAYFCSVFKVKGAKVQAQILATALAVYVTDKDLAGGNYAASYGFTVNSNGTGAATFNVGSYGSAIGLTNNKSYTIMQILTAANKANADDGSSSVQTAVNNLFDAINNKGDI
jgi:hypothetical protein